MTEIAVPAGVQALLFDCDGTLADTMPLHWEAWDAAFDAAGVPRADRGFMDNLKGRPAEAITRAYNAAYGQALDPVGFSRAKQGLFRERLHRVTRLEPVTDVFERHRGVLPMAVVSGGTRENVLTTLDALGLGAAFEVVITACDALAAKPAPDMFLAAAARLGVPAAVCQVFEDGEAGLEAARRAGMIATDVRPYLGRRSQLPSGR